MISGPSYFGGQYVAANFAFGLAGGPQNLTVHNVPQTAGTKALTVAFGYCTTVDGYEFYPLSTDAPIMVGSDSNVETVTPTAVSDNLPGYGAMNFTAAFSNAHAEGDPVVSATVGLQEAINLAIANGGGVVIVDAEWERLGGTTAMINTAVYDSPATVSITDNR